MRIRALTLVITLVAGGCAVVPYPSDWPATVSGDEQCLSLSGDYDNVGYSVQPNNPLIPLADDSPGYLTRVLFGRREPGSYRVRLEVHTTGRIVITSPDSEGKPYQVELQKEDAQCSGGKIRFATKGGIASGGLAAMGHGESVSLSKAADGSLIVEGYEAMVGFAYVVPIATVGRGWMRFPVWGSTPTAADLFRAGRPYDWPRTASLASPPILLRERKPLYGAYSNDTDDHWARRSRPDCSPDPGDPGVDSFARVRDALITVSAAEIIDEEFRAALPSAAPTVGRSRYASSPKDRVAEASEFASHHAAPTFIVVDVEVQFGVVQQGSCFVKLFATAEVRVQPKGERESKVPLYDIWARLERVPVEAWAQDPASARNELMGLLRQIGRDLAISYREWNG